METTETYTQVSIRHVRPNHAGSHAKLTIASDRVTQPSYTGSFVTIELPDDVAAALAAAAAERGMTADELAAETLASRFIGDALAGFIGNVDSGDPHWAETDTAVLRKAADAPRSA